MAKGKHYVDAAKRFDRDQQFTPDEGLDLVKSLASAKFDETVELVVRLGVDPRKADQIVRGTVALPSGTGKDVRVAVFAAGEAANEARAAGADLVGADDLAEQIQGGMLDFDLAIATPDLMPLVGRLGRVLGPRGLMPNPKTGTVTTDVGRAVTEFKGGRVEYRTDRYGNVHIPIGRASFEVESLLNNFRAVLDELQPGQAGRGQGQVPEEGRRRLDDGPRCQDRHQPPAPRHGHRLARTLGGHALLGEAAVLCLPLWAALGRSGRARGRCRARPLTCPGSPQPDPARRRPLVLTGNGLRAARRGELLSKSRGVRAVRASALVAFERRCRWRTRDPRRSPWSTR